MGKLQTIRTKQNKAQKKLQYVDDKNYSDIFVITIAALIANVIFPFFLLSVVLLSTVVFVWKTTTKTTRAYFVNFTRESKQTVFRSANLCVSTLKNATFQWSSNVDEKETR